MFATSEQKANGIDLAAVGNTVQSRKVDTPEAAESISPPLTIK